jgi:hypothetical protein
MHSAPFPFTAFRLAFHANNCWATRHTPRRVYATMLAALPEPKICACCASCSCSTIIRRLSKKFPADASGHECYHCFSLGGIVDECPKCNGKPWSEEFLAARHEIDGDEKDLLPF